MTGKELAAQLRKIKGKVSAPVLMVHDAPYIYVEKADLINYFKDGTEETGMSLREEETGWYLDSTC